MEIKIPENIKEILLKLEKLNFEAYIVGGSVRDLLLNREIKDWDLTTNAKPEEIIKIFPDSFCENEFGTVGVKIKEQEKTVGVVEITTFRIESQYSDKRHPDKIKFAKTLEEDLSRRDFTVNAMALKLVTRNSQRETQEKNSDAPRSTLHAPSFEIIDLFDGKKDLKSKLIKAVGNANKRFSEDALRMMRAIRFAMQLNFSIEKKTLEAIKENSENLTHISQERIKDELNKIILSDHPDEGIEMLHEAQLLKFILPELEKGIGIKQNMHHIYTIYKHCLLSLKFCPSQKLEVRLASLLHDIAKPQTKRGEGTNATFYNHDHVGARVSEKILKRLRYSNDIIEKVKLLVDNHMFYYNPDEVGESSVRRLVKKVGLENIQDLIDLRIADRLGSGVPKGKPYKLRHLEYVVDKVSTDAISVKMLKINGADLIKTLEINPGPQIGAILDVLLSEVIELPEKNDKKTLLDRAKELKKIDLEKLRKMAKIKIEEKKEEEDEEIKKKHWVK